MKKYIKIIIINILILITFFCIIEFLCYKEVCRRFYWDTSGTSFFHYNQKSDNFSLDYYISGLSDTKFKVFKSASPLGGSIVVTGCSMAYGESLDDEQTVSYKLSKLMNKTVYNYAIVGGGLNHILYMLEKNELKNYIDDDVEYFLYFYNPDHLRRIFIRCCSKFIFYEKKKNGLQIKNDLFLENFWSYILLHDEIRFNTIPVMNRRAENYFLLYLSEIESKIKALYPNAKFVIVKFSDRGLNTDISKMYNVIDIPKLTNIDVMSNEEESIKKYNIDDAYHPNENYWNEVLPVLIEELRKF